MISKCNSADLVAICWERAIIRCVEATEIEGEQNGQTQNAERRTQNACVAGMAGVAGTSSSLAVYASHLMHTWQYPVLCKNSITCGHGQKGCRGLDPRLPTRSRAHAVTRPNARANTGDTGNTSPSSTVLRGTALVCSTPHNILFQIRIKFAVVMRALPLEDGRGIQLTSSLQTLAIDCRQAQKSS